MDKLQQEIALTGCGWVTPFSVGDISKVLSAGTKASSPCAGKVPDELLASCEFQSPEVAKDKSVLMAAVAIQHAMLSANLTNEPDHPERLGLAIGCAQAGQLGMIRFANEVREQSPRFVSPLHFPQTVGNYVAGALARALHARGPNLTISCGVASGLAAIWEAATLIASDKADIMFAGGVDPLLFDLDGAGDQTAEGACIFVVESVRSANSRGVPILARIVGLCDVDESGEASERSSEVGYSAAGLCVDRAVCIEAWIGECGAALGAGAVAASIGASNGMDVPRCDAGEKVFVEARRAEPDTLAKPGREPSLVIASSTGKSAFGLSIEVR